MEHILAGLRAFSGGILKEEGLWSYPVDEERQKVRLAQEGDKEALASLYEDYLPRVYRYVALRLGDWREAEDITADIFIKMVEKLNTFEWRGVPFSAWLFRIAHNQMVDHFRKGRRQRELPLEEDPPILGEDPVALAERNLSIQEISQAMEKLSEKQRQVLSLRFASELSIAEVARIMGKGEGAIKALQHSAVVKLRRLVGGSE